MSFRTGSIRSVESCASTSDVFKRFCACQNGATAIEYSLVCAGITVLLIVAINSIGTKVGTMFTTMDTNL